MVKTRVALKYAIIFFALFSQGQVFAVESSPGDATPEMAPLKSFGLDKRVKVLGALLLIFAPIGLIAYNRNRTSSNGKESDINVLEKKALDQSSSILLVEIRGTTLLLSKTSTGISLIKEITNNTKNQVLTSPNSPLQQTVSLVSNNS